MFAHTRSVAGRVLGAHAILRQRMKCERALLLLHCEEAVHRLNFFRRGPSPVCDELLASLREGLGCAPGTPLRFFDEDGVQPLIKSCIPSGTELRVAGLGSDSIPKEAPSLVPGMPRVAHPQPTHQLGRRTAPRPGQRTTLRLRWPGGQQLRPRRPAGTCAPPRRSWQGPRARLPPWRGPVRACSRGLDFGRPRRPNWPCPPWPN